MTSRRPPLPVSWQDVLRTVLRVAISVITLGAIYFLAPMDRTDQLPLAVVVVGVLVLTAAVGTLQVRAILRSSRPSLRAVEALAFSVPLLILGFAAVYFLISQADRSAFTESLSRADALYLAVTVFATVGFGDITPTGQQARMVVTGQMVFDLLLLGVGLKVVVGAVRLSRDQEDQGSGPP